MPAFFALSRVKGKRQEKSDANQRCGQNERRLKARRQIRKNSVEPQEEEIRLRRGLDDRGIRLSCRTVGPEDRSTHCNRREYSGGKDHVFPKRSGNKRNSILV